MKEVDKCKSRIKIKKSFLAPLLGIEPGPSGQKTVVKLLLLVSLQITPATSYAGTTAEIIHLNPHVAETGDNPDLLSQLRPLDDEIRLALLNKASQISTIRTKLEEDTPPQIPRRSTSYDIFSKPAMPKLSPPTPFADDSEDSFPHIIPTKKVKRNLKNCFIHGSPILLNNVTKCCTNK